MKWMRKKRKVPEEVKEIGACLVIGQGDFSMTQSNRGADDPGDNTLSEPQYVEKIWRHAVYIRSRKTIGLLYGNSFPEENGEPCSLVLGSGRFCRLSGKSWNDHDLG